MAKQIIVPERIFNEGVYESPEVSIGRLERYTRPTMARMSWPGTKSDVVLKLTQLYSFDGGLSWIEHGGAEYGGGTILKKDGTPLLITDLVTSPFPDEDNRNRRVKFRIEVRSNLRTSMELESSENRIARVGVLT